MKRNKNLNSKNKFICFTEKFKFNSFESCKKYSLTFQYHQIVLFLLMVPMYRHHEKDVVLHFPMLVVVKTIFSMYTSPALRMQMDFSTTNKTNFIEAAAKLYCYWTHFVYFI